MTVTHHPSTEGLYDPRNEHDSCGIGFVVDIKNRKSHQPIRQGLEILANLSHRGAVGADPLAGDGAGILLQIPDAFLRAECSRLGIDLPSPGEYAVGMIFLPRDAHARALSEAALQTCAAAEGQMVLGWRDVPTDNSCLGHSVRPTEPVVRQVFIRRGANCPDGDAFERKLFVTRKQTHHAIWNRDLPGRQQFYVASLSSRTIVYKGMILARNISVYYPELRDPRLESALALVHQRFSTNTFPSWSLAHPF
ncbi:MAG: glutamate synthase subunit alpha, partial [Candidatus Competibacter sp.]|nr:glutamate synthase subunit alpha [Candidatus Competibacter sp.]